MNNKYVSPLAIGLGVVLALALRASAQDMQMAPAAPSEAQKSFDKLKTLAGTWGGPVRTNPLAADVEGKYVHATLRVTSMGNAIMHEMHGMDRPDDPITMLYLDGDRLMLTHYCDAGNRPRMTARASGDGKTVEFDFLDVAGPTQYGHMDHAVFTIIDANHHTEEWTYMMPGDKPMHVRMELTRTK